MMRVSIDDMAKSVADEVHRRTSLLVGYSAKMDDVGQRVLFTFKLGAKYIYDTASYEELKRPPGWQPIFDRLVDVACKGNVSRESRGEPEIPIVIDQRGKRHLRLVAETGYIGSRFGT